MSISQSELDSFHSFASFELANTGSAASWPDLLEKWQAQREQDETIASIRRGVKDAEADGYQVVPVAVLGHKADVGFMALGPDQWRLRRLQTDLTAAGLELVDSYVSLTEISEYVQTADEFAARLAAGDTAMVEG